MLCTCLTAALTTCLTAGLTLAKCHDVCGGSSSQAHFLCVHVCGSRTKRIADVTAGCAGVHCFLIDGLPTNVVSVFNHLRFSEVIIPVVPTLIVCFKSLLVPGKLSYSSDIFTEQP